jgi:hypothetical protein
MATSDGWMKSLALFGKITRSPTEKEGKKIATTIGSPQEDNGIN